MYSAITTKSVVVASLLLVMLAAGCGGGKDFSATAIPKIAGSWELVAVSTQSPGVQTGLDANLQQGQTFVTGAVQETGQLSAVGIPQILLVGRDQDSTGNLVGVSFAGFCGGSSSGSLSGTLDPNYNLNLTYTDGINAFSITAILSSDAQSVLGTYASQPGSACVDNGTITGKLVPKLSGTYLGQLAMPDGSTDNVSATLSESSPSKFSANLIVSGPSNTSLSLTGVVTGNAFSGQGTFESQSVAYYGYFYQTVIQDGINQGLVQSSIYLVDATDPNNLVPAGTLSVPIPPP